MNRNLFTSIFCIVYSSIRLQFVLPNRLIAKRDHRRQKIASANKIQALQSHSWLEPLSSSLFLVQTLKPTELKSKISPQLWRFKQDAQKHLFFFL